MVWPTIDVHDIVLAHSHVPCHIVRFFFSSFLFRFLTTTLRCHRITVNYVLSTYEKQRNSEKFAECEQVNCYIFRTNWQQNKCMSEAYILPIRVFDVVELKKWFMRRDAHNMKWVELGPKEWRKAKMKLDPKRLCNCVFGNCGVRFVRSSSFIGRPERNLEDIASFCSRKRFQMTLFIIRLNSTIHYAINTKTREW